MENKTIRFLSLLLAFVMVLGMFPVGHVHVHAAEGDTALILQKVTSVEAGEQYVITFAGQTRAAANETRSWGSGKGNGLDTTELPSLDVVPDSNYLWTMEAAEGGFKIRGVKSGTYVSISANNAVLGEDGQIFTFTQMDGATVIRVKDGDQRFNNLGNENCVGGWNSDGTKFDLYKVTADPYGKLRGQWSTYHVDTQHPNIGNEGLFSMAFDNNPRTHWHSKYSPTKDQLNGSNAFAGIIDLGNTYTLNWFSYTPRTDLDSGLVTKASLYVSNVENANKDNANDWILAAEDVTFDPNRNEKVINFTTQSVRYVKFVAKASNDGWVTASEFNVGYNAPPECEHSYNEEIIKAATCIEGQKKFTCTECGYSYLETIPATDEHTEQTVSGTPATFENTGLTDGTVCTECGRTLKAQEVIPAGYNTGIVPKEHVTLTAGTWEKNGGANEGGADLAWDDNFGTMWHTDWSGTTADKLWIQFDLSETYNATALRYKPRANAANGTATKYEIQVSHDGENFFTVKTGTWEATDSWKVAEFDAHNAKIVRLVIVEFVTDQPSKKLASAAEIRLVGTPVDHEHDFVTTTTPATCTVDGSTTISCSCGDTHTTVIPATGHQNTEVRDAVAPTLTTEGYTGDTWCLDCNTKIADGETIAPLTALNAKALLDGRIVALSACEYLLTSTGENTWSLSHAGTYFVKPSADGNNANPQSAAAFDQLTLTANGDAIWIGSALPDSAAGTGSIHVHNNAETPYWNRCSDAHGNQDNGTHDLYFFIANNDGTGAEIPGYTMVKKDALVTGNSYLIAFKNDNGNWYIMNPSDVANDHVAQLVTDAVTHTHSYTETITPATCQATGLKTLTCDCGHKHIEVIAINPEAHNWDNGTVTTEPGCETEGVKTYTCSVCGGTKTETIPATGNHSWNEGEVTTAATCTDDGVKTYTCSVCGGTKTETIPATGHVNTTLTGAKEATCGAEGYTGDKVCDKCGVTVEKGKTIPATGNHNWNEGEVTTPATCTDDGVKTYTCSVCGGTKTETIPATGHVNTSLTGAKEATCGAEGYTGDLVCACGEIVKKGEPIPATGNHTYDNGRDTDCNNCGETREVPKFEIEFASVSMHESLNMNFAFAKDMVADWDGHYVVITKENGETQTVPFGADWVEVVIDGVAYYYVTYTGIAAKEMTDVLVATVFNADGEAVSESKTDSILEQSIRNLGNNVSALNNAMVMNMLNYGAEAQKHAGYNLDKLANADSRLKDYRQYATESVAYENNMKFEGKGKYLANVKMVEDIKFMMAFSGIDQTMTATVTTEGGSYTIEGKDFVKNGGYYVITLDEIFMAEAIEDITVVITDAEGNVVATVTDSIASYAARAAAVNADLSDAIMKFVTSVKAYVDAKK